MGRPKGSKNSTTRARGASPPPRTTAGRVPERERGRRNDDASVLSTSSRRAPSGRGPTRRPAPRVTSQKRSRTKAETSGSPGRSSRGSTPIETRTKSASKTSSEPWTLGQRRVHPPEMRMKCVQRVLAGDTFQTVSKLFGPQPGTIRQWFDAYERGGVDALAPKPIVVPTRRPEARPVTPRAEAVTNAKRANPTWGTRRIRDVLARFEGLGVSESEVRRILHESGLIEPTQPRGARDHLPRRFERAAPNQMWQSDLFTFLLRRHERLYLVAFMDDHSRFVVSYALAHHQKSEIVLEALTDSVLRRIPVYVNFSNTCPE